MVHRPAMAGSCFSLQYSCLSSPWNPTSHLALKARKKNVRAPAHISWLGSKQEDFPHFIGLNWVIWTLLAAREAGKPRSRNSLFFNHLWLNNMIHLPLSPCRFTPFSMGHFAHPQIALFGCCCCLLFKSYLFVVARKRINDSWAKQGKLKMYAGQVLVCVKHQDSPERMRATEMNFLVLSSQNTKYATWTRMEKNTPPLFFLNIETTPA